MSDPKSMKLALLLFVLSVVPLAAGRCHGSGGGHSGGTHSSHSHSAASHHSGYTTNHGIRHHRHERIKRSRAARHDFMSQHPCPSTRKANGRCPGYVVDHVNPLECGGADTPSNMQWQTVAARKANDKTEGRCL